MKFEYVISGAKTLTAVAWPQFQGRPGNTTQVNYLAAELPFLNCC